MLSPEPDIFLKNYRVWSVYFDFQCIRRHGRNMFLTQLGWLHFASQKCHQTKSLSLGLYSMSSKWLQIDTPPIPLCYQCAEIIEFICSILVIHLHFCFELDWNDFLKLSLYFRNIQQISSYCVCHMLAWSAAPYPVWTVLYENLPVVPYVS